jgi:hypothetical protein
MTQNESRGVFEGLLVPFDGQVERALMKVEGTEEVICQDVVRLDLEQAFELASCLTAMPILFVNQSQQQSLIGECVAKEQPTLGAELVLLTGQTTTARAAQLIS